MIEMKQVLKVVISISFVTVACCVLYAQEESNDDPRVNANLGGILSLPLHPTKHFATIGGGVVGGAGYNFNRRHAVLGEFMFNRLSAADTAIDTLRTVLPDTTGYTYLYSLTANYRLELRGNKVGTYLIGGGGWYHRINHISNSFTVPTGLVCTEAWVWWGAKCQIGSLVPNQVIGSSTSSAFGGNVGIGFTARVSEAPYRIYLESRYHYAPTNSISTQLIMISVGIRY
jgi:hypothetical protein